jgi:hypothetical protein
MGSSSSKSAPTVSDPSLLDGGNPDINPGYNAIFGRASNSNSNNNEFAGCCQAVTDFSPQPTYIIYPNGTIDIEGLPAVCISELNTHNALPNITKLDKWEGSGLVLNSTAIQTSGVGNSMAAYLETVARNIS